MGIRLLVNHPLLFSFLITMVSQENFAGRTVANNLMTVHVVPKQAGDLYVFIAFLKCSKRNYQIHQVLEKFKYSF